jgi:hypothetical protein
MILWRGLSVTLGSRPLVDESGQYSESYGSTGVGLQRGSRLSYSWVSQTEQTSQSLKRRND